LHEKVVSRAAIVLKLEMPQIEFVLKEPGAWVIGIRREKWQFWGNPLHLYRRAHYRLEAKGAVAAAIGDSLNTGAQDNEKSNDDLFP